MRFAPISAILLVLTTLLVSNAAYAAQSPLSNAVILIIRHAEKPDTGSGLTPAGEQRAAAYVAYFEHYHFESKPRPVDSLFATADSAHSQRPRLTLAPLGAAMKLAVDNQFSKNDIDSLVQELTIHPGGKTILVCWHHEVMPELLRALGADPDKLLPGGEWPPAVYNWVIQLPYDKDGHLITAKVERINEHLMPGDMN